MISDRHDNTTSRLEIALWVGLVMIVALAPLPLGSNRPLPMAMISGLVGLLVAGWGLRAFLGGVVLARIDRLAALAILFYGAVCLWILAQALPLDIQSLSDPIWKTASDILKTPLEGHISVNPHASLTGLMHLLSYAGVFWLSLQLNQAPDRATASLKALALIGAAYALYGIIVFFSGDEWILFYRKWTYFGSLTSTFVNRNSYATFAGLTLLAATVFLIEHLKPVLNLSLPWRPKAVLLVETITSRSAWVTFLVVVIALALLLSASRAGTASSAMGLSTLLLFYFGQHRHRNLTAIAMIAGLMAVAMTIFSVGGNHLTSRLTEDRVDSSFAIRASVYRQTFEAIKTVPWTGTGFGTYAEVFPAYRSPDTPDLILWDKAHNTYLENALELGVPAAALLDLSILLLAVACVEGVRRRNRQKLLPALGVAATVLVGMHALVDFSLQIPAVSILFAYLMGLAVSQSHRSA